MDHWGKGSMLIWLNELSKEAVINMPHQGLGPMPCVGG
jgi:hypothetical protein